MVHEFNDRSKLHINRDDSGIVRNLLHIEEPYIAKSRIPQLAAQEYLEKFHETLGITIEELRQLSMPPEKKPIRAEVEYRFLDEKTQFDMTIVVFSQTYLGLPVLEAGIAVHIMQNPLRVISVQSTQHTHLKVSMPEEEIISRLEKINVRVLEKHLGLFESQKKFDLKSLHIEKIRLIIYRYEEAKRVISPEKPHHHPTEHLDIEEHLTIPLPRVAEQIEQGHHYVAAEIIFVLDTQIIPDLRWIAIIEAETLSVLHLRPLVDTVDGLVFKNEPMTDNGGPLPNVGNINLNPLRSNVPLLGLAPPISGIYALTGDNIQVTDVEPPPIAPPTAPVGTNFDFDARTDNFAAVNAYYHCDRFFRLVKDLGFDLNTYFGGTIFPTAVDHRGSINTPNGIEVNAHCLGNGTFGILRTTFALADTSNIVNPIGIACDWRVVLHELGGHGILYNHINVPNFLFAHSAGDSFGAILNDPESLAPDRFVTFPWVNIGRRHDRSIGSGWAWGGFNDTGGYNTEQILCTTHFRLYRSIGGDSTEVAMRHFAARYAIYLILRLVGSMTQATQPANAASYAALLMTSDFGNWTSENQVGGTYSKVIRWAFEQQGLYQPLGAPTPVTSIGAPPPVDVYIEDGRQGEYQYGPTGQFPYLQRFWETIDIWNRLDADGQIEHQTPFVGKINYAYVRIKNRGIQPATSVVVHGYHCRPTAGLVWPDDWKPMKTDHLSVSGSIPPGGQVVVGPFDWKPKYLGHECMFMSVSASGDRSNNDVLTLLPCAIGPSPLWRLVPCDNNLALRAIIPVPGGGGRRALVSAFRKRRFWASNPFAKTGKVEVRAILPNFLLTRGWAVNLVNRGVGTFSLGPRETRVIRPRLIGGQNFTVADVISAGRLAIELIVLVDGLVVGGITYLLDPKLKLPALEFKEDEEEDEEDEEITSKRIKKVRKVRRFKDGKIEEEEIEEEEIEEEEIEE